MKYTVHKHSENLPSQEWQESALIVCSKPLKIVELFVYLDRYVKNGDEVVKWGQSTLREIMNSLLIMSIYDGEVSSWH